MAVQCANMSGHINGAQALIKQINPLALYTHCQSHKLNLALARCSRCFWHQADAFHCFKSIRFCQWFSSKVKSFREKC